ncbi:MAG TPA: acyl-CoA dehydrogenase family protein [Pseudonocardia sp.]|nr:acyl-CoA dehydrogenase family protein [Pseudonocardia sp.]
MVAQGALADSAEQRELRDSVRRMLRDRSPLSALRERADAAVDAGLDGGPGFDRELWGRLVEMGLTALTVPEKYDGLGQTALETHVVFEELGRALYLGPYLATVGLAVPALLRSGDDAACADLLPAIAAGELIATVGVAEADGRWDTAATATRAESDGDSWLLTGTKEFVLDGADADLLLVTARHGDTADAPVSLFAVEAGTHGLTRTPLESLDLARSVARVTLDATPARLIGAAGVAPELVAGVLDRGLVALAAEQAGGAAACLDMCVEYAKTRQQFGQPIGSFQAIAHKCVDMLHGVEFSRASARYAAAAEAEGDAEFPVAARVAAAYCGQAFRAITVETVQVHGGTGFTWEHDTHLYYRRAWSSQQLLAGRDEHYAAIADRVGL